MNKRAHRCAVRSSTRRKQNNGIKNETQSRAERAIAAKPLGDILRAAGYEFIAFLYAVDIRLVCDTALFRRILVKLTENSIRNIMTAI